jgi:hypothetical protein
MIPETIPGMAGGGIKERGGGSEFKYNIFDTLQMYQFGTRILS